MIATTLRRLLGVLLLAASILMAHPDGIHAQESGAAADGAAVQLPDPLTREALRDLLARLSDDQVRGLLLSQLDQEIANAPAAHGESFVDGFKDEAGALRASWAAMFAAAPGLPFVPVFFVNQLIGDRDASVLLLIILGIAGIFLVGCVVEWVFRRVTAGMRRQILETRAEDTMTKMCFGMLRIGLDLLAIAVFATGTVAMFFVLYQGHEPIRLTVMAALAAVVVIRVIIVLSRFILAPNTPGLRLVAMEDEAAKAVHHRVVWIAGYLTVMVVALDLLALFGLEPHTLHLLGVILSAIAVGMLIAFIWRAKEPVARLIRGSDAKTLAAEAPAGDRLRNMLAAMWPGFASLLILGLWFGSEVNRVVTGEASNVGLATLILLIAVPMVDALVSHAITAFVESRKDTPDSDAGTYGRVAQRVARFLLVMVAIMIGAGIWGIDLFDVASQGVGERAVSAIVDVSLTLLVAYIGWEIAKAMIDRQLAVEGEGEGPSEVGGEGGGQGASRLRTLLPLFRKFLMVTLGVMVILLVLSSLGVDIGPLLAGAGVVGLAIGFGAQTLVRDIMSGVFFLVDDAFRMGEYVDIGGIRGTVENISIRSLRLRHHRGALHTVPFGEIQHLTNHSRDWVIMKLMFRVPYDTDLMKVKKIFKKIGAEMMADPLIGPNLLDPPKSQGVLEIDDSAMVIRAKFMAKPGEQFVIRRELFQRVQQEFEAAGIEFARKQVSVYVPPSDSGEPHSPEALAAAAAVAVQQAEQPPEGQAAR